MITDLGKRLQEQRLLRNLSQKEVATVINTSASIISNYENSERTPSVEVLIALASLYRCSTDYLLGFQVTKNKTLDVSMLDDEQISLLQHFLLALNKL